MITEGVDFGKNASATFEETPIPELVVGSPYADNDTGEVWIIFPSKNNKRNDLTENSDGSVDLYFGPKAPSGKENNWIQTTPKKGWFAIIRLYGPLEPWFDKTWRPGEIELVE